LKCETLKHARFRFRKFETRKKLPKKVLMNKNENFYLLTTLFYNKNVDKAAAATNSREPETEAAELCASTF
jgi:hypothetical protein